MKRPMLQKVLQMQHGSFRVKMKEKRKGGSDQVALETRSETARYSESRGGDIHESASAPSRGVTPFCISTGP